MQLWVVVNATVWTTCTYTLKSVDVEIGQRPRVMDLLISGDLNTDLESEDGHDCDEAIAVAMSMEGLET